MDVLWVKIIIFRHCRFYSQNVAAVGICFCMHRITPDYTASILLALLLCKKLFM